MEEDFGSWFQHGHSDSQSPIFNSISAKFDLGQQNTIPIFKKPCLDSASADGTFRVSGFSGSPNARASEPNDTHNWFYGLPNFHRTLAPELNSGSKEQLPASLNKNCDGVKAPNGGSGSAPRRFLIFDQCGDQTLIFSPRMGAPVDCSTSWTRKLPHAFDLNKDAAATNGDTIYPSGPLLTDEYYEPDGDDVLSEMHEDTEELNALLYSDYESDCSDDDEEASTGHSPFTMTAYDKQEWLEDGGEEVASSAVPSKRQKLSDGVYDVPFSENTSKVMKLNNWFEHEDAESSGGNVNDKHVMEEVGSLSSKKRARKQKIRKTVSILRTIIPSGKGKDAIGVLDEAIDYLKSMKPMAEDRGFDAL